MSATQEKYQFKTEVQQLMNIIVNSLYSNKEIFLRELISNASDAIDKLRFKSQTDPDILGDDTEFKIKLISDGIHHTLEVTDNGIGMTREEVMDNIGTIAKSGSVAFLEALEQSRNQNALTPELIGQFGVGFYSAFIVAEEVTLISRAAGSDTAIKWVSTGDGTYTIEETDKPSRGTTIILKLKPQDKDEPSLTEEMTLRGIVKKHSDFVNYPIVMDVEREEPIPDKEQLKDKDDKPIGKTTQTVVREETLNSMKAIWTKPKKDVTDDEYKEFYNHISHDWNPPLSHLHFKLEGTTEYTALLYIPSKVPFDLFNHERKHGVQLYCKRVFIMENCEELLPEYFRFIKGVVDAPDLNLNVSREILQQDRLVRNIRRNLIKKLFDLLSGMEQDDYEKFYAEFGPILKIGIHSDIENRPKIADLARYKTTKSDGKFISLKTYVENMQADQEVIYYITGDDANALINSPHLEQLKEKDYEVLLMTDPVDEWAVEALVEYEGKKLQSAEKGDLELDKNESQKNKQEDYNALFGFIKSHLSAKVKEVKSSTHLKDSMACLSGDKFDMSAYMEKLMKATGQSPQEVKRILELNIDHPVIGKIKEIFENDRDNPRLKNYSQFIYDVAVISEGGKVENPAQFSKMVGEIMTGALG
jgi:molecular chaperone HtpG